MSSLPSSIIITSQPIPKDKWIDDFKCNRCHICADIIQRSFMRSNKHHCRYCGWIICSKCSQNKFQRKRICNECIQNEIVQQIRQRTSKYFIHALIIQHKIISPAVFIGNQIVFYQIQNKKELQISASKTLKISQIFDVEYTQFQSVKRLDLDTHHHIILIPYHSWHRPVKLTFTNAQKRNEWYIALESYITKLMEKERKRNWELARQKDYFKDFEGFLWKTENKIKSINPRKSGYVHGSYVLDCNVTNKVIWQFKIDQIDNNDTDSVIIGIDNENNRNYMDCFDAPTPFKSRKFLKTFALCNNGKKWMNNDFVDEYNYCGNTFKSGDIVTMIYRKPNLGFYGNEYCIDMDELTLILSFWIRRENVTNYTDALDQLIFQFYFYNSLLTQFRLNMEDNKGVKYRMSVYLQFNAAITLNFFHQCKAEVFKA